MNHSILQNQGLLELTDDHIFYMKKLIKWLVKEKLDTSNSSWKDTIDGLSKMMKKQFISKEERMAINLIIFEHNKWVRKKQEQERLDSLDELTWAM